MKLSLKLVNVSMPSERKASVLSCNVNVPLLVHHWVPLSAKLWTLPFNGIHLSGKNEAACK